MFKVGQIVWCNTSEQYTQTDYHVKCMVTSTSRLKQGYIEVRIIEGRYAGNEWDVETVFFEPVQARAKII